MLSKDFVVFVVDDDPAIQKALKRLLEAKGYRTDTFASAAEFLSGHDPSVAGCVVIDLAMPGLDGLALQNELAAQGSIRPVIFVSGRANLASGIQAMRSGAVDFLEKPVDGGVLVKAIERAATIDRAARAALVERDGIRARLKQLTPREFEVLSYVIAGRLNKQIAYDLGTVEKTIKVHRRRMMTKMAAHSVAELVRMTEKVHLEPHC